MKRAKKVWFALGMGIMLVVSIGLVEAQTVPIENAPASQSGGFLYIYSEPSGASVAINDVGINATPVDSFVLKPGRYIVKVRLARHETFTVQTIIRSGEKRKILVKLAPRGSLAIVSTPDSAHVVLNNQGAGTTPFFSDSLAPGAYTVNLSHRGYHSLSRKIIVTRGKLDSLKISLVRTAFTDSLKRIKHNRLQMGRRIVFGIGSIACLGIGLWENHRAKQTIQTEQSWLRRYNEPYQSASQYNNYYSEYEKYHKKADTYITYRILSYIGSGIFGAGCAISIFF